MIEKCQNKVGQFPAGGKGREKRGEWRVAEALRDNAVNYVCRDRADHL